jgi:hypothetical protein
MEQGFDSHQANPDKLLDPPSWGLKLTTHSPATGAEVENSGAISSLPIHIQCHI